MILNVLPNICDSVFIHLQREITENYPYFPFEMERQAKKWQGGVIIGFSHISKDGGRKYIIVNKNLIFLGAGKN